MNWISVDERLPTRYESEKVLASDKEQGVILCQYYQLGNFENIEAVINKFQPRILIRVTHWMPLPKGPK